MPSTNHQPNPASRSHLPSHTRTPSSRSHEAARSTIEDILYSASRTPKSRVSRNARRRRRRLQAINVQNQTAIPSTTQLPLDVTSTTDLQTISISHALQETLSKDVIFLQSTIPRKSRAPQELHGSQELQESQDEPTTSRVPDTSPIIRQSLPLLDSQVLSPGAGDEIGRHTSQSGHHNASQLDEIDREILAVGSVEQKYQSISTKPLIIQELPLDDLDYQQVLPFSHRTLTRNLKHSRNVPESVSQDLAHVVHQIDPSNNPISPAAKRRCQYIDTSTTRTNGQRHNDNHSESRSQDRRPKSKSTKKKRRVPDGELSLGSHKAEPQFADTDEDQEMIFENDPIIMTQPSTPPSRQGRINEAELLEEPRKQKSKLPRRQNPAQKPFFSQIDPTKFMMPLPYTSSPSAQALTRKIPSYRDGFEGREARPTGNVVPIRKPRPRNPPVDPLSLRMGRLTIMESRCLRDDVSPSPKPRNHSPTTIMEMNDESQRSANCQGTKNTPAVQEAYPSMKTCIAEKVSATSVSSAPPKTGCLQTRQKPKRQVTFDNEVENIDDLHLPFHNFSPPVRQVALSDEEDESDSASDIEEEASEESHGMEEYDEYEEHSEKHDQTSDQEDLSTSVEMNAMTEEDMLLDTDGYEGDYEHNQRMSGESVIQRKQHCSTSSQKLRVVSESAKESKLATQAVNSNFASVSQQMSQSPPYIIDSREVGSNTITARGF